MSPNLPLKDAKAPPDARSQSNELIARGGDYAKSNKSGGDFYRSCL